MRVDFPQQIGDDVGVGRGDVVVFAGILREVYRKLLAEPENDAVEGEG